MKRPGAGFLATLAGIGMTVWSWYAPWSWPAFPASFVIDSTIGQAALSESSYATKAVIVTALIFLNSFVWAAIFVAAHRGILRGIREPRRITGPGSNRFSKRSAVLRDSERNR